ncbi:rRNA-processing protein utp23 [Saitozyma sp. JCM 24511]|nr:rRNA-processing protein utp23 [Saitozyma sp. JCM 24511]
MRQKRAKTYKRVMALYVQAFGFRQPYQVLVSNDLIASTAAQALDIRKGLSLCVQGEIKPMITQCCIEALYALGKPGQPIVNVAKTFERRRCNHREAIAPDECIKDVVGPTNKHRYVLALQSPKLLSALDPIPGLPIIHFNPRGVLVLSPPGTATVREKNRVEEERRMEGGKVLEGVVDGGNVVGGGDTADVGGPRVGPGVGAITVSAGPSRRSRVKGPNPLSMKKKKTTAVPGGAEAVGTGKKRSRLDAGSAEGGSSLDGDRADRLDRPNGEGGANGEGEVGGDGDGDGDGADGRRKKKRRRRAKGAVASAIAEIRAEQLELVQRSGPGDGGDGEGSGGESD